MTGETKEDVVTPSFSLKEKTEYEIRQQLLELMKEGKTSVSEFDKLLAKVESFCKDKEENIKNLNFANIINGHVSHEYETLITSKIQHRYDNYNTIVKLLIDKYDAIYKGDRKSGLYSFSEISRSDVRHSNTIIGIMYDK